MFGPYQLDAANARLWCKSQPVRLTAKALQVLEYLAERPGRLVTKDELFSAVWPDTIVSDATLASNIQAIRQALGDDSRHPQYIETVHRQGFRFIGEVVSGQQEESQKLSSRDEAQRNPGEEENPSRTPLHSIRATELELEEQKSSSLDETLRLDSGQAPCNPGVEASLSRIPLHSSQATELDAVPVPVRRSWSVRSLVLTGLVLLVGVALAVQYLSRPSLSTQDEALRSREARLPLPDKSSLIMLPLVNLSGDPEQEYFSDGLTEVLTGALSKISGLFVIARNSAFTYKGKAVRVQDISREMGVRYVLEGSVQKAEQRIRIAVHLIDATTGYEVWSEQYDRPLTDIFALQDEIVQKIVTTLKLQLTVEEQGFIVRKHTNNLEAYDAFLRGVEFFNRYTKEANAQARQMFEKAVALDPQYAEAYAWLSSSYRLDWIWVWNAAPQVQQRALTLAQQAITLDEGLPIAHSVLSWVYAGKQQPDQAITEGERAIALDPNDAESYARQADVLNLAGRPEEALWAGKQAMRLNPHYPPWYLFEVGMACYLTGRYTEAIAVLKDAVSRSPNLLLAHHLLAISYFWQWVSQQSPVDQTLDLAVTAEQRALALNDSWHWSHMNLGYIFLYQRQYEQALTEMERAVALAPTEAASYACLAMVLSHIDRTQDALEAAAQALRLQSFVADGHLGDVSTAYAVAGRYEEARAPLQRFLSHYPNFLPFHVLLAVVYSELGQEAEAQKEAAEVLRLNPKFSLEVHRQRMPIKDPAVLERHIAALRKAGLK